MNRERFIKPKIDKYIQLYSKKAKVEEGIQTIKTSGVVNIANGGSKYPSNQNATITAPQSGTTPTVQLTVLNGVITNAVVSNFATSVYNPESPPRIILPALPANSTSVKSIEIVDGGEGYTTPPKLIIGNPPTVRQATLTATFTNSGMKLGTITIVDGGAGYTTAPTIKITADPPDEDDFLANVSATITNGVITAVSINNTGSYQFSGTDPKSAIVSVDEPVNSVNSNNEPVHSNKATATCTIDSTGRINSVSITNQGLNYTSPPDIQVEGNGFASLKSYLTEGFGADLILDYEFVSSTIYKYSWDLESPIELNENGLLQVVHREFYNVPEIDKPKIIVMRLHDISSKSVVNTRNTSENVDFNGGVIVDIGKVDRLLPNEIILEINQQTLDRITLSLNYNITGTTGFNSGTEFLVLLKVVEKEPSIIEYGTLNNINFLQ